MFKKLFLFGGSAISAYCLCTETNLSEHFQTSFSITQDILKDVKKWNSNWDLPDNNNNSAKSKATRNIILIRHGQYNFRENDDDCKLTLLGREQADHTGIRLKELGIEYDALIHSTMTRAIETANIISKCIPSIKIQVDSDLAEGTPFVNEPELPYWNIPESVIREDHLRIEKAFRKYFHRAPPTQSKDSFEILVCHANVIRYMVCRALQFPPEGWIRFSLDHASITWVSIRPNGYITVRSIGNSGHMPSEIVTV